MRASAPEPLANAISHTGTSLCADTAGNSMHVARRIPWLVGIRSNVLKHRFYFFFQRSTIGPQWMHLMHRQVPSTTVYGRSCVYLLSSCKDRHTAPHRWQQKTVLGKLIFHM